MMGLGALVEALGDVTPAPFDLAVASALIARLKGTALFGHSVAHRSVADTEAFAAVRGGSSRRRRRNQSLPPHRVCTATRHLEVDASIVKQSQPAQHRAAE
jgi:hypothetical protein